MTAAATYGLLGALMMLMGLALALGLVVHARVESGRRRAIHAEALQTIRDERAHARAMRTALIPVYMGERIPTTPCQTRELPKVPLWLR